MRKEGVVDVLRKFQEFKKGKGLTVIDSHVHPLDVMGIVHHTETIHECNHEVDYLKPGLLETFDYSMLEKLGSRIYFKLFPKSVSSIIRSSYEEVNSERIIQEMQLSLVDQSVLLSLDPWVPTDSVGVQYKDKSNFLILGSIDVHSVDEHSIEKMIKEYIDRFKIVGLKFHPNLQNFKPQPRHNNPQVASRLRKIYEVASKYDLYILFHGGISNYVSEINKKYNPIERNRHNALLHNFFDGDGKSEIFENYTMPVVIAHLGHYGMIKIDFNLLMGAVKRYDKVFFDTSGISSNTIRKALNFFPSNRIVFGSDALYNRIAYNVAFLYNAVMSANSSEKKDDILLNVFGNNFSKRILNKT